jgi:signal transduction histidine kinase
VQGKQIALSGCETPVWIQANAPMVSRAIRNLVENAIRHTPAGTTVDVEVAPDGTINVKDNGHGVPESDRELVFRRFWRARRDNSQGAGLGLAIVSRIAEIHGAEIVVGDNPDGGAAFSIRFRGAASG